MTWREFKRQASQGLAEYRLNLKAIKYLKKAIRTIRKDRELSLAYRSVADVYDKRAEGIRAERIRLAEGGGRRA